MPASPDDRPPPLLTPFRGPRVLMNYFAHAIRFLDRPVFAIATGLPDMLSVVDRRMRLRARRVEPFADGSGSFEAEVAAGALQHLEDDRWFHSTRCFVETCADLTRLFRETIGDEDGGARCAFLGHIVTELQLDGVLIEQYPELLDRYYELLDEVDAAAIEESVNRMATKTSDRLAWLIERFREAQFMRDYVDPSRLKFRLNQIMLRVRLAELPDTLEAALAESWDIVRERFDGLLPREHFKF